MKFVKDPNRIYTIMDFEEDVERCKNEKSTF